jgi:hypothetical protein
MLAALADAGVTVEQNWAALSKVQSVDQRMRLECGVGFHQLRTCRRTRPGELWAKKIDIPVVCSTTEL